MTHINLNQFKTLKDLKEHMKSFNIEQNFIFTNEHYLNEVLQSVDNILKSKESPSIDEINKKSDEINKNHEEDVYNVKCVNKKIF